MSSNTKKLIILIAILVFLSILMSSVCGLTTFGLFRHKSYQGSEQTFKIKDNFSDIKIETDTTDIRFYRSEDRTAKAVWIGPKTMKLEVKTRNNTLSIREKHRFPWFLRFGINFTDSKLSVYLPKDAYDSLYVETDTGSVQIPASFRFEKADIETDTGAIEFLAKVSKDLKIESDTGGIQIQRISPESLSLKTDTGSISISDISVSKVLWIKTQTGRLILTDVSCRDLKAESDTGSISLTSVVASDEFKAKTDTGSIRLDRCDAGSLDLESDTGSITGTLLSDKVFVTKSDTGKIIVPETRTGGICKIETDTGRIEIEIVK